MTVNGSAWRIFKALEILLAKVPAEEHASITAEHDEVWLPGPPPSLLSEDEREQLAALRVEWWPSHESWHVNV